MTVKIATLGVLRGQIDNLKKHWDFPYQVVDVDQPTADGAPHEVDVVMSATFSKEDAKKVSFRLLQSTAAGVDKIDFSALPEGAVVCNMFGHEQPIAEYTVSAMLNSYIDWQAMQTAFNTKPWGEVYFSRPRRPELGGKTVGIIGFGHIGQEVAKRLQGFGVTILAVASRARETVAGVESIKGAEGLDDLLKRSDFVVLAMPLTATTKGMIGKDQLALMKPSAYLINVGRGALADEEALFAALKEKKIRGAALDSWFAYPTNAEDTVEPTSFGYRELDNVVNTPHTSAWTQELSGRRYKAAADNIRRLIAGEPLENMVTGN